ncbi:MAG TPA: hypothetical protein VFB38_00150 [Chthonomonadaceae bacterium]|nr:hypothetical protein [Chthonomonadaceae bacterium]
MKASRAVGASIEDQQAEPTAQSNTIRLLVVDDHPLLPQGLIALVERHPGFSVVAEATNGREAVELIGGIALTSS